MSCSRRARPRWGRIHVKFTSVTSTNVGQVYVQGQLVGSATLTGSAVITSTQGGRHLHQRHRNDYRGPVGLRHQPESRQHHHYVVLAADHDHAGAGDPEFGVLTYAGTGALNPGIGPFDVTVTQPNTLAGTVTTSPVVFNPGDSTRLDDLPASGVGHGDADDRQPTLPAAVLPRPLHSARLRANQSITATVTAPNITVGSTTIGEFMQGPSTLVSAQLLQCPSTFRSRVPMQMCCSQPAPPAPA